MTYQTCSVFGIADQAPILEEIDRFEIAVKDFFAGKIQTIYQDTTEFSSDHLSHCPLSTLENVFPIEKRKDIYCMHFSNDFLKKIEEKGFKYVQVKNISAN